ncbi:penicillin-binding protein activator [Massilia sp. TSP1-1-2]|uniref:penicillin-binding protein activator n=1 Tax=Massilia sp. TSP1-1-2 TaxID=2804649 RepID=UPI003CF9A731
MKMLKGVFATAGVALLGACSTPMPCDPTGGLCAPMQANTSGAPPGSRAADATAPRAVPNALPNALPPLAAAPGASVQTMPVETPDSAFSGTSSTTPTGRAPVRIALLLPTRAEALRLPAEALRAGFMAAYEHEREGVVVNVIETSDDTDETLNAYMAAKKDNDIIVGPLSRAGVGAVAASGTVSKPTIALNHPDGRGIDNPIPPNMLVIGLSIEDEARQVAQWAAAEHPGTSALVVSGNSPWQRRLAAAFAAQWKQLGNQVQLAELTASNGYLSDAAIVQLKARVDTEMPAIMFAALDAEQARQVRAILGSELPAYGASSVNPGLTAGGSMPELDGLRLLDMPWQIQGDNPAVMVYPRFLGAGRTPDLDRLYALGIDAFRVTLQIAKKPVSAFRIDGVTGRLTVNFGNGTARFERVEPGAVYQSGSFKLVDKKQ